MSNYKSKLGKLIVCCGLPASGKGTYAEVVLKAKEQAVIISSDHMRFIMYGDESIQGDSKLVFSKMFKLANKHLSEGTNVILDATNVSRKKRTHMITHEIKASKYEIYYMNTHLEEVIRRNNERERNVPREVIDRMYKTMQIPVKGEGWNEVHIIPSLNFLGETVNYTNTNKSDDNSNVVQALAVKARNRGIRALINQGGALTHKMLFKLLGRFIDEFNDIYKLDHDSKYHSLTVSEHTYEVYKAIYDNFEASYEREVLLWASLFHDLGKAYTKSFYTRKGEKRDTASFIGHEYVSSQLACYYLTKFNVEDIMVRDVVTLVQFHMYPMKASEKKMKQIEKLIGKRLFNDLMVLHKADKEAK